MLKRRLATSMEGTITNKRYTIEATAEQVRLIRVALEFYERIVGLGQVEYLEETLRWRQEIGLDADDCKDVRDFCDQIKQAGWGYAPNESGSIGQAANDIKVCYDMQQAIDKATRYPTKTIYEQGNEPWLDIKLKETP